MVDPSTTHAELERLFAAGDHRRLRSLARRLIDAPDTPPEIVARARELLATTGVDPATIVAVVFTALVIAYLVIRWVV